jgi:hypothetical protein
MSCYGTQEKKMMVSRSIAGFGQQCSGKKSKEIGEG